MNNYKSYNFLVLTLILTMLLTPFLSGCSDENEETEIAPVNVSKDTSKNIQVAKDLAAFDYRNLVIEKLGITDEEILMNISWYTVKSDETGEIKFKLNLSGKAREKSKELEALFSEFVNNKVAEYEKKLPEMDEVEKMASYYIEMIATSTIDSVWLQMSPTFSKYGSKTDFGQVMSKRKTLFKPQGKRHLVSRRISQQLGEDLMGDFCTVTFEYDNKAAEEVTMEKINGQYKLLGYHFVAQ